MIQLNLHLEVALMLRLRHQLKCCTQNELRIAEWSQASDEEKKMLNERNEKRNVLLGSVLSNL